MLRYSIIVIARDEERCIQRCLTSALSTDASEVLVVDTGSIDETMRLARATGDSRVRVESVPWRESFAEARNAAIALARHEVVMFLDADEWIRSEDVDLVREVLTVARRGDADVLCPRILESGTDYEFRGVPRFVLRSREISYRGRVHEYPSKGAGSVKSADVDIVLYHDGYSQGVEAGRWKSERNDALLRVELTLDPSSSRYRFFSLQDGIREESAAGIERKLALLKESSAAPHDLHGADHYIRSGHILSFAALIALGDHVRIHDVVRSLATLGGGGEIDAAYFQTVLNLIEGVVPNDDLLVRLISAREDVHALQESLLSSRGRHLDAAIAFALEARGQVRRSADYRAASEPWTDAFFVESAVRTQ